MSVGLHPLRLAYVVVFALTAVGCFVAVARARERLEDPDTRWGLIALLATSGLWASFHVGRLVVPLAELKLTFYILGLTVGLASVGAWLYFCSAYAGETYHRESFYRRLAVGVFVAVVSVKITSPIHGLYFSATAATAPFPHLSIRLGVVHWVVTGVAYALSAVGFYILFDVFRESNYATTRLGVLVGLAGVPVVLDVLAYTNPDTVVTLNYEPIGVGLFALGVLYVAEGSFLAVRKFGREQLLDELDEGVVLVDDDGVVRDTNAAARRIFPGLEGGIGERLTAVAPEIDDHGSVDDASVIEIDDDGGTRYYHLSAQRLGVGKTSLGRAFVCADITDVERQRRELALQRAQFDDFAAALRHELRNTINVVQGSVNLVGAELDPETDATVREGIDTAVEVSERMNRIVSDLAVMAQFGQSVEETTSVDVASAARRAFASVAGPDHRLDVGDVGELVANEPRLERLLTNLFRFAVDNGATRIELDRRDGELVITDDGAPLDAERIEEAFAYGEAVPNAESGMVLPVVRTLAEAHGWDVTIDAAYREGVRVRITY
jgi:signal transduction histidine kinase